MASLNNENRTKFPRVGSNRWSRVRQAYEAGELDRQNLLFQSGPKRPRRNALADISTNTNSSCQKHQFHQLVERVRELQNEIVPDMLLYQLPQTYSPFSPVTPVSSGSRGSISIYPHQHRQSISLSSGSSNPSLPLPISNQRFGFGLSARILERAHQIPERFWIDWQQKQMQDQIEELEYIKQNIGYGSNSSLLSNETDENGTEFSPTDHRNNYDDMRRKSLLFLHEAQRLANERRTSLARMSSMDTSIPKKNKTTIDLIDNEDHSSFNFDQRSEETTDTADLNDVNEIPSEPITSSPLVQQPPATRTRPRSPISLPFTYTNTREEILFPNTYRQKSVQPTLEKVIEINDDTIRTTSPIHSTEEISLSDTEHKVNLRKREDSKQFNPLVYSNTTVNRTVEFHKFRSISSRNYMTLSNKNITVHIPVSKRKEIDDNRSSSPTLSFKSAQSRFSSMDNVEDLDDDIQSISVIPSSLSVSSHSRSTSPHIISTNTQCCNHNNNYSSLENQLLLKCICSTSELSMTNVDDLEQNYKSSSYSSYSPTSSEEEEEEDNLSFSRTLFTCRRPRQRRRKEKGNASNLSLISTPTFLYDSFYQAKENDRNNNNNHQSTLKTAHNTSITSSKKTGKWKQNVGGFQRDVLTDDNNDDDDAENLIRSSSAATAAADYFIRRQHRKQTRLKKKTGSEKKKKKKKKKKERNKKSPSSTTAVAEASLFQFYAVDTPTIDTSASFYPHEQARYADKNTAKEKNCFAIQTLADQQQKQEYNPNLTMADGHGYTTPDSIPKKKENVRVFVRRRQRTTKQRKRPTLHSSSSGNSHETIPSPTDNVEELVSLIQQQLNNKQKKSRNNNNNKSNIIVVNYKPVFVNSRPQKSTKSNKTSPSSIPKLPPPPPIIFQTDDDFSSATHYSRPRSFTTTSSDGSPLRSTTNRSHNHPSVSLDVPDVEDPLMFIEMMYQQLFTEDGRLRSGTEPTALENCVKQIITNSRRNSVSSSVVNGSASSHHLKPLNLNTNPQQRKMSSSKPRSLSTSPRLISNEHYKTFSDEEVEEEEPNTIIQINSQHQTNNNLSERNSQRLTINNSENHSQIEAFLNSCQQKRATTASSGFRFSIDDTDNEDLDTFSDLNSIRFNNKTIRTSPSVDEDLTHTDSRLLSSSGYQSLDRSTKSFQQKPILPKSHSENDLITSSYKPDTEIKYIHYCPNCIRPPNVTVIPSDIPTSSTNIIKRIQQPMGYMLMKYLNFLLMSKNVLLIPLFIFLLRQRSLHLGN